MVFVTINVLHVSGGSSAHHQELKTLYTALGICQAFCASYPYRESIVALPMYVCMYVCVRNYVCMYVCMFVSKYVCMYVRIYVYMCAYVYMYVRTYVCTYVCSYMCV